MVFANIEYLFLLLLLIPYIVWYILKQKKSEATLQISDARVYAHTPKSYKNYLLHVPFLLRCLALVLVILVLARPQTTNKWQNSEIEGIDIMLAIDVSTSMLAEDLKPNRLEAAKDVAAEFINFFIYFFKLRVARSPEIVTICRSDNLCQCLFINFYRHTYILHRISDWIRIRSHSIGTYSDGIYTNTKAFCYFCRCHRRNISLVICTIRQ